MDLDWIYRILSEFKDVLGVGLLVIPIFQYFKFQNIGGMLVLPILVSILLDAYSNYLVVSGSWTIIIEFIYPVLALLLGFGTFGLLIINRVMFRVAFIITAVTLMACIVFVFFHHGIERTNLMRTTFIHGLAIPAVLGVSIMLELDHVVSSGRKNGQWIMLLNRAWIFYFVVSYAKWNVSYFIMQFEDHLIRGYFSLGLDILHVIGYLGLLVSYVVVINKTNLKPLWKIPQTS